jgi:hypothetical protein
MDPVSAAVSESMNRKTRLPISDDEAQVQFKDTRRQFFILIKGKNTVYSITRDGEYM